MISHLSSAIAKKLIRSNIISEQEFELYHYGLFVMLTELFLLIYCLAVGLVFRCIAASAVFFAVFFLLHKFAGGFHAKTELHCQLITLTSFLLCIAGIRYSAALPQTVLLVLCIISSLGLIVMAPADTPQKPLSKEECKKFKKLTAAAVVSLCAAAAVLLRFPGVRSGANAILFGIILESVSVAFGKIFNKRLTEQ